MYAVMKTGGKQYTVQVGDRLKVEKLKLAVGDSVEFDQVLLLAGDELKIGKPFLEGAKVRASVKEQGKAKKVLVGKFRPKSGYRRTRGHRQAYTLVEIEAIEG